MGDEGDYPFVSLLSSFPSFLLAPVEAVTSYVSAGAHTPQVEPAHDPG